MKVKDGHPSLELPSVKEMYRALCERDSEFDGVFFVGVRTTGVFCRTVCSARKPKLENIDFYRTTGDALSAGFRPCKKCRPMEAAGSVPDWLRPLLEAFEQDVSRRWTDGDIRALNVEPVRVRRWFKQYHGMTFHAYMRSRRLSQAMGQIQVGKKTIGAAIANGYESKSGFNTAFKKWSGVVPTQTRLNQRVPISINRILTPLGPMVAGVVDDRLCLLEFADRRMLETQLSRIAKIYERTFANGEHPVITKTQSEITEYFERKRQQFTIPLATKGTDFQGSVWNRLLKIPYGRTTSYEKIARQIGNPHAQRAVGRANGDNRIAIIIPCHRVIRSDGALSGYGGQVWRKKWLLQLEQNNLF